MAQPKDVAGVFTAVHLGIRYLISEIQNNKEIIKKSHSTGK